MPNFSLKPFEFDDVWRERPELLHIASSYRLCGSLNEGTLRGREKADIVVWWKRTKSERYKGEVRYALRIEI
jgi:hypothetical protein